MGRVRAEALIIKGKVSHLVEPVRAINAALDPNPNTLTLTQTLTLTLTLTLHTRSRSWTASRT